jgi:hypothetical protein
MLDNAPYVGFIPVTDLATARRFFVDTLGLKFVDEDEYALVVSANGTTIRITPVADLRPQPFTIAGWQSDDVAATVGQLKAAGVVFRRYDGLEQDELDIWHAPGGSQTLTTTCSPFPVACRTPLVRLSHYEVIAHNVAVRLRRSLSISARGDLRWHSCDRYNGF